MAETTVRENTDAGPRTQEGSRSETEKEKRTTLQGRRGSDVAPENRGSTTVADAVVVKIAGMAAREIPEIHNLGRGMARAFGAVRERVPGGGSDIAQGVKVEVGERQAAVDLDVVVEYGAAIADTAADVRRNVISAVERMTGLEVVEVNIAVGDVHLPDEEEEPEQVDRRVA
ncbi:Asp23/Gls24 family envelope stress response protein [Streptomyces sp. TRM68367]|uniref:Asp23/Gls24 family envelope stress response protein n=1 Tax=Streptomyces sp. TRM68367 TaxID=2758415 RepID=UPI00165C442A|nr:Asp23/Gls24 family envelope stress response protein [Streptomyces sp. TRM68367]MBC9731267.1 Asp23/Gls24 family envelope stress response protein [Streptomyces sp. TRM68367]